MFWHKTISVQEEQDKIEKDRRQESELSHVCFFILEDHKSAPVSVPAMPLISQNRPPIANLLKIIFILVIMSEKGGVHDAGRNKNR